MSIGIGLGLANFTFSSAAGYWRWVRRCDEAGVDSLWQTDRLVSREPYLECMSAMAGLAGATTRLKFGMNVAMLAIRDPLLMAKQCGTIDYLSDGRLLPAFGIGSTRSRDFTATGRTTKGRGTRMNEALELLTRLWTEESVTFRGEHFTYDEVTVSPRPVQTPVPLWIGGSSEAAIERTARWGTGWQGSYEAPEQAGETVAAIQAAAAAHGRSIDPDHMGIGIGVRFGNWDEPAVERAAHAYAERTGRDARDGGLAVGGGDDVLRLIERFVANGIAKFILRPIADGDADMLAQTERLIAEVLPEVKAMNARRKAAE